MEKLALHPLVASIAKRMDYNQGRPCYSPAVLEMICSDLAACPEGERETVAEHLLALALELRSLGEEASEDGVTQLCMLAFLVDQGLTQQALARLGTSFAAARRFLGAARAVMPATRSSVADAGSLFATLLRSRASSRDG